MTNLKFVMFMAAAALAVSGCTAFGPAPDSDPTTCTGTADDLIACTVDVCSTSGAYQHIPYDAACAVGQMCSATAGCIARDPICPASCDDGVACTVDSCASGACRHVANDDACSGDAVCRASAADGASGCYTAPVASCASGCDDSVACTIDSCTGGVCLHFADVTECAAGQTCHATRGCESTVTPPPVPAARFCATGGLVGELVRISIAGMSGIHTFADRNLVPSATGVALWTYYGSQYTFGPGEVVELAVDGGTLNVHPYEGGSLTFDSRMANLQSISSATNDVTGEERGIVIEVLRSGSWVRLPEGFAYFGMDTDVSRRWGASPDPLIPSTASRVGRLLVTLECEHQYEVYDNGSYRAAR